MQNKFNEITEAYATLSDDYKRDVYDDELDKERNGDFNTRFSGTTNFNTNGLENNKQFIDAMKILDSVFKNNPFFANNGSNGFFTSNSGNMGNNNNGNSSSNPFDQPFFRDPQKFMAEAMKNGNNGGNGTTTFSTSTTQNNNINEDDDPLSSDYEYKDDDFDLDSDDDDDTFGNMDQEEYYRSRRGKNKSD